MNDVTYTFNCLDNIFTFTIKKEFLQHCAEPSKMDRNKLFTELKMGTYLHNPYGPALTVISKKYDEYWLEGKRVSEEVAAKIKHQVSFHNDLEKILTEEET